MEKRIKIKTIQVDERATEDFWKNRKINWNTSYFNEHTHRDQIIKVLKGLKFDSVLEVGCGAGKNLDKIRKEFGVKVLGIDINVDAVKETSRHSIYAKIGMVEDIDYPNKSIDLLLTDAMLIYVPPEKIKIAVSEMIRVARKYIIMCEWHNNKDKFDGHWVYSYSDLFNKYRKKFTKIIDWGGGWSDYGNIIVVIL